VTPPGDPVGEELATWGKVAWIETRGRTTGKPVGVAVGFVQEPDGAILVAAGDPAADWARNLERQPACRVRIEDRSFEAVAEPLDRTAASAVVVSLILRYGTPAEGLGRGPAFRLRPIQAAT
jgi:deazaflavin-dependent oxidoreductase (nitroreductase family)